jgi:glyoxylase-like metal-dependent hydrolase (beta-lactamase superfamily II)
MTTGVDQLPGDRNLSRPTQPASSIAIHVIQTGDVQIKTRHVVARRTRRPARALDVLADRAWTPRLPIRAFAIEHPEGLIVVDTGESSHANDPGYQAWWHPFMRTCERRWVTPDEEVGPQLRALGHDPTSARHVVMTHMHGDHAGGLPHFPGVDIILTTTEASMAMGRTGQLNGYLNSHYPAWFSPRTVTFQGEPWETFDASIPLTRDGTVRLIPTPGHTLGHMSVVVDRGDHLVLLCGDATYSDVTFGAGSVDGVAQSAAHHRDSTRRMRELCARHPTVLVPTHDPAAAERLATLRFTKLAGDENPAWRLERQR